MRLADFHRFVEAEFGDPHGSWLLESHVLAEYGATPAELIERGVEPRDVWWFRKMLGAMIWLKPSTRCSMTLSAAAAWC